MTQIKNYQIAISNIYCYKFKRQYVQFSLSIENIKYKRLKQNNKEQKTTSQMKIDFASLQSQLNFQKHNSKTNTKQKNVNANQQNPKNASSITSKIYPNQLKIFGQSKQKNIDQSQKNISQNTKQYNQVEAIRQKIKIAVMYPYEISKSLSPQHYKRQITYLQKQNIIPQSALKYIQKQVETEIMKANTNYENDQQKDKSKNDEQMLQKNKSNINNNQEQKIRQNVKNNNTLNYFNTFGQKNKKLAKAKRYDFIKPKIQTGKNKNSELASNRQNLNIQKQLQITRQKSIQQSNFFVQSSQGLLLKQTLNSKVMKKVIKKRQNQYQKQNTNVYNKLYQNSSYVQLRKKLKREQQIQNFDNEHKKEKFSYAKKYITSVKGTFFQRLQKSIQKIGYKQRVYKAYDMTSRKIMFQPDILQSKRSYQKLFKRSLQKNQSYKHQRQEILHIDQTSQNERQQQKDKSCIRNDRATTRISSKAKTPFESTKRSMYNSFEKDQKKSLSLNKSLQIIVNFNTKVVQRIINIFYPEEVFTYFNKISSNTKKDLKTYNDSQITIFDSISDRQIKANEQKQLQVKSPQDFVKTVESFSELTQQQYNILEPLFQKIQLLQKSTRISRIMFKNLLMNYIKKLNLYDQMILREPVQVQRKKLRVLHSFSKEKEYIQNSTHKKHINNIFKLENKFTHTPTINIKSQSLQKLVSHHKKLYYI